MVEYLYNIDTKSNKCKIIYFNFYYGLMEFNIFKCGSGYNKRISRLLSTPYPFFRFVISTRIVPEYAGVPKPAQGIFYDRTEPTFPYFSYLCTGETYLYASAYQGFTPENLRNTPKTEL